MGFVVRSQESILLTLASFSSDQCYRHETNITQPPKAGGDIEIKATLLVDLFADTVGHTLIIRN
jgi:hypothetical protein